MEARLRNLDALFKPRSIAFVGATEESGKWGFMIFNNILRGGWEGRLYPVNPRRESVLGIKAYPTVRDIPDEVDLVVVTVPASRMMAVIDDCLTKKVRVALLITAGFREMGGDHAAVEEEIVSKARAGGLLIVGPNCQGICCPGSNLYPQMASLFYPISGRVGAVSQSGNILNMLIGNVLASGQGITMGVSSGNEADLHMEDYLEYYAEDPQVDAIVSYVESVSDGRRFFERCRSVTVRKPVIVLKGGRTRSGQSAASSHTGALAVSDHLFSSACAQAGILQARTIEDAGVIAASFINRPLPRGNRVVVVTGGGGLGVIAADVCTAEGLDVVRLSPKTLDKIARFLPDWWVPGNPVDLVAGNRFESVLPLMETLIDSGEIDAMIFTFVGAPKYMRKGLPLKDRGVDQPVITRVIGQFYTFFSERLYQLSKASGVAIYPVINLAEMAEVDLERVMGDHPMSIYRNVEPACMALSAMARYQRYLRQRGENHESQVIHPKQKRCMP